MVTPSTSAADAMRDQQAHDLDLLESAVALVACGGAPRAILVLHHGELSLAAVRARGRRSGVAVRAARRADGGCDIVVEPVA